MPGVYLNDGCRYSVKAYAYARDTTVPVPQMLIRNLIASLKLDRLTLHQTFTDSTVTPAENDKGKGLEALVSMVGLSNAETIAVGDSEPDLAMFRAATRSHAPGQISCSSAARHLGCRIASAPYQPGLLEIVRRIVHSDGSKCERCLPPIPPTNPADEIFVRLLQTADRSPAASLLGALLDPAALRAFAQ
jgi:hypothetical protein